MQFPTAKVDVYAIPIATASATDTDPVLIGSLNHPASEGVSVSWDMPPDPRAYTLKAVASMTNGDTKEFTGPKVTVKQ